MVGTRPPREDGAVWTSVQRLRGRWSDYWHPKAVLSTATMQDLRIFRFFQRRPFKQQRLLFMPELSATHRHPSSLQTTPSNTSKALFRFLSCIQPRCHDRHVPSTRRPHGGGRVRRDPLRSKHRLEVLQIGGHNISFPSLRN